MLRMRALIHNKMKYFQHFSYGANNAEQMYENNFNTLGRNNRIPTTSTQLDQSRMMGSRLSFQDNIHDILPVTNYYSRFVSLILN